MPMWTVLTQKYIALSKARLQHSSLRVLFFMGMLLLTVGLWTMRPAVAVRRLPSDYHELSVTVQPGDNLTRIFKHHRIPLSDMYAVINLGKPVAKLKRLLPGQKLYLILGPKRHLRGLSLPVNHTDRIEVVWKDGKFEASVADVQTVASTHFATFTVDHSLYIDGMHAGLSKKLLLELADIFGWEVDFKKDLRRGDHFDVLYQTLLTAGNTVEMGDVVDVRFTHNGRVLRATRFTDSKGITDYYDPQGFSWAHSFVRKPLHYSHISSLFNPRRMHPILHIRRPHWGVDFAAPRGTKVWATGKGKVTFMGRKGGYGRVIMIRHNSKYTTVYGHLRRFARHLHVGSVVQQKQIIGYVGSTGLATGPHLHYEVRVKGHPVNPLHVHLPRVRSVHGTDRERFATSLYEWSTLEQKLGRA